MSGTPCIKFKAYKFDIKNCRARNLLSHANALQFADSSRLCFQWSKLTLSVWSAGHGSLLFTISIVSTKILCLKSTWCFISTSNLTIRGQKSELDVLKFVTQWYTCDVSYWNSKRNLYHTIVNALRIVSYIHFFLGKIFSLNLSTRVL